MSRASRLAALIAGGVAIKGAKPAVVGYRKRPKWSPPARPYQDHGQLIIGPWILPVSWRRLQQAVGKPLLVMVVQYPGYKPPEQLEMFDPSTLGRAPKRRG
jgi:hypothetical protein